VFWLPRMIDLDEGDLYVVPKGTKHRPVYESAVIYILIEPEGILNPCNTGGS
jgi:mannose-6-phosphate isomerase-like protein (cupin superfamily)